MEMFDGRTYRRAYQTKAGKVVKASHSISARFGIWCKVSDGVTGHRTAWLKSNGAIVEFDTFDAAEAEAKRLNHETRSHPWARFEYLARQR